MSQAGPEEAVNARPDSTEPPVPPAPPEGPPPAGTPGRRFRLLFSIILGVVVVAGGGVGVAFYVLGRLAEPGEQTAKFLPQKTPLYFSMNIRPGAGQLLKFREILSRFAEDSNYEDRVDDGLDEIENETRIDLREDLFPWMGPELSIAVVDFGDFEEELPDAVAFIGTTDPEAAKEFLRKLRKYLEDEQGVEFKRGRSRGFTTYGFEDEFNGGGVHFTVTDEYVVFATTDRLLDKTLRMMEEPINTLSEKEEFLQARTSAQDPRFSMLYLDTEKLLRDLRRSLQPEQRELLRDIEDNFPKILTVSSSVIDMGIKVIASYKTPPGAVAVSETNSLLSADYLPSDTLALISVVGVREAWDQFRQQMEDVLEDPLDFRDALREFEDEFGLEIEEGILGWMTGEVALALLPSEFTFDEYNEIEDAMVHAVAMFEFDEKAEAEDALDGITDAIEDEGVDFDEVRIRGQNAVLADLTDQFEDTEYEPGYLMLENHVVVGTTRKSLERVVDAKEGSAPSLASEPTYRRILDEVESGTDFVLYANVGDIVEMIIDALDPSQLDEYEENVAPFVEPIQGFSIVTESEEERSTFTIILTFE